MPIVEPTVLDVTTLPTGFQIRLARPGEPFAGPTQRIWNLHVGQTAVRNLCRFIEREVGRANAADLAEDGFGPICNALLDEILSDRIDHDNRQLREALRSLDTPLQISTEGSAVDAGIYWELLKFGDGDDDYLGLRCDVGRRLKTRAVPAAVPRPDANFRGLLIADPNSGEPGWELPDSAREVERLRDWLVARHVDCSDHLVGVEANHEALFAKIIGRRYDIIHFAGHVVFDAAAREYGLRLHGGHVLLASSIRKHLRGSPLVFLNGCSSSASLGAAVNRVGGVEGMTNAFLEAGAQLVVGALFDTPDVGARAFAEKFYEGVLEQRGVGEAMRLARRHVRGRPGCGAAWASFVLYGDPCLKLAVRADRLSLALQPLGLGREHFDTACLRTLERAFAYAAGTAHVATAHLLAALIEGESSRLRDGLQDMGVAAGLLSRTFQHVFAQHGRDGVQAEAGEFSDNVRAVLDGAVGLAREAGRSEPRITELDVLEAFARHGGGSAGELLRRIGVDVASLAPPRPAAAPPPPAPHGESIGPLSRSACTGAAWQVLVEAGSLAARQQPPRLGTTQLLAALLRSGAGPLPVALARRGIDVGAVLDWLGVGTVLPDGPQADRTPSGAACSANAAQVLVLAAVLACGRQHEAVDEIDLLQALLQHDAGIAPALLRDKLGISTPLVLTELFDARGALRADRVDTAVLRALDKAAACAGEKGHSTLSRTHLLHGLLADADGSFVQMLRQIGCDASTLADRLYVAMPRGDEGGPVVDRASAERMSAGLVGLLRAAELEAQARGERRLGEAALIHALLVDGCGEGGRLLVDLGVGWTRLKDLAGRAAPRQLH